MKCPYKDIEDVASEKFQDWSRECTQCRHYEECKHKEAGDKGYDAPGDNHPNIPKCTKAERMEVLRDFEGVPAITKEDVTDMIIDLHTLSTATFLGKCHAYSILKRTRRAK